MLACNSETRMMALHPYGHSGVYIYGATSHTCMTNVTYILHAVV